MSLLDVWHELDQQMLRDVRAQRERATRALRRS